MSSDLGYYIHPADQINSDWYWQLDINLCQHPTNEHFDPERIEKVKLWKPIHLVVV